MGISRDTVAEWLEAILGALADDDALELRSLCIKGKPSGDHTHKGLNKTLWSWPEPGEPGGTPPPAPVLVESIWTAIEEADAADWKVIKARAHLQGGGELPSKSWSGPGKLSPAPPVDEEPVETAPPLVSQEQIFSEAARYTLSCMAAQQHVIDAQGKALTRLAELPARLGAHSERLMLHAERLSRALSSSLVETGQAQSQTLEALAEAREALAGQEAAEQEAEIVGNITNSVVGHVAARLDRSPAGVRLAAKTLLGADRALLKEIFSTPEAQAAIASLMET